MQKRTYPILLLFFGTLLINGCSPKITLTFEHHFPYCGGMMPDSIAIKGRLERSVRHAYILVSDNFEKQVVTDAKGQWRGRINMNKDLTVIDSDKRLGFETLKAKYQLEDSINYRYMNLKEFEQWRLKPTAFLKFETVGMLNYNIRLELMCFVGKNPIIIYKGPKPR